MVLVDYHACTDIDRIYVNHIILCHVFTYLQVFSICIVYFDRYSFDSYLRFTLFLYSIVLRVPYSKTAMAFLNQLLVMEYSLIYILPVWKYYIGIGRYIFEFMLIIFLFVFLWKTLKCNKYKIPRELYCKHIKNTLSLFFL